MRSTRILIFTAGLGAALMVTLAACSGSSPAETQSPTGATTISSTSGAPAVTTPSTVATDSGLSGTWSGNYSGANQGTFTLTWQESGSKLTGTIDISSPSATYDISGAVEGNSIRFGTLGAGAVTYSGSVSGDTMSGTYQAPNGNGTWQAAKAS